MSEFFLELFSEEIPSNLQQNLREDLLKIFNDFFLEKSILFKKSSSYSTPNRLVILFEGVQCFRVGHLCRSRTCYVGHKFIDL